MAENLLYYGFSRGRGNSVEEVIARADNLIRTSPKNEMKEFLEELKDMKSRVEQKEFYFYQSFGVSDYQGLNRKIEAIEKAYAPLLTRGEAIWNIRKNIDFDDLSNAHSPEEIKEALTSAIEEFLHEGNRVGELEEKLTLLGVDEKVDEEIGKFLQKNLRFEQIDSKKKTRFITSRSGEKIGLGKFIIGYDFEKHEVIIDAHDVRVSPQFKKKIESLLDTLLPDRVRKRGAKTYTDRGLRKRVNELALEKITDQEAKNYIIEAMKHKEQFDLKANLSSVIGYLGEVRAVAMLNHLMPKSNGTAIGNASGVGNIFGKFAISGRSEEIPIDVVCMSQGFQIKNYTLTNNKVTFSNRAEAPYILSARMHFTGPLYETLIALFGAYQYNQPMSFSDQKELPRIDEYRDLYSRIYADNDSVFRRLEPLFNSRIPHMLRMSERFKTKEGDFTKEDVYFNTFYWINKKLVPSSYILTQIIDQLEEISEGQNVTANYYLKQTAPGINFKKIPLMAYRGKPALDAARYLDMGYEITIDLSDVGKI